MFVKKIPRWKIKRFIKGVIRSILFFVVFSSFIITCNASSISGFYDSWSDLVDDSRTEMTVIYSDGYGVSASASLYPSPSQPDMFYALQNSRPIDTFTLDFKGDNILHSFKANDVLIFSGILKLTFNNNDFDPELISQFITFNWEMSFSNDDSGKFTSSFENFEYNFQFNQSTGKYEFLSPFTMEYTFPYDGSITSFYLTCGDLQEAQQLIIYPGQTSSGEQIVYYIGDRESAPIFKLPDQSGLEDGQQAEDDILDFSQKGFSDWGNFLTMFPSAINNVMNWVRSAGDIFEMFYLSLDWPFNGLVLVLLCIGTLSFAIGITTTIISKSER